MRLIVRQGLVFAKSLDKTLHLKWQSCFGMVHSVREGGYVFQGLLYHTVSFA